MRNSLGVAVAIVICMHVFFAGVLAAVFGGDAGRAMLTTLVAFLKPFVVLLTVFRVASRPPTGAGQLRGLYAAVRRGERSAEVGPLLLAVEAFAAVCGVAGFVGIVFFTRLHMMGFVTGPSLAELAGYGHVHFLGSVASLGLYAVGVAAWSSAWVLEGLSLTATGRPGG